VQHQLIVAYLSLGASMALVGTYVGLSKLLLAAFPVFLLAWLRFAIAAVAMAGWAKNPVTNMPLSSSDHRLLFWESFLGNFLFSICMLFGVAATSALAAGVVMAGIPAAVALLSWFFLREPITLRVWCAIAFAVVGIGLLAWARVPAQGQGGDAPWWGYGLLVCAVLCEASYVVIGKTLAQRITPKRISALINLWGLALMTPLGLWQALSFNFTAVARPTWGLLVFYALAASVATVWLWMRGLQQVPAQQAGVFTVMLPMAAALVGIAVLGEAWSTEHVVAFVLALFGLFLATWPTKRRAYTATTSS
jgi:drug/metabolite transporter (DMT)-like permease